MVLLTMTASIVDGLDTLGQKASQLQQDAQEPTLTHGAVGNPISHAQILRLWKQLQSSSNKSTFTLESLLVGAKVYCPPPPPKAEKVSPIPSSPYDCSSNIIR